LEAEEAKISGRSETSGVLKEQVRLAYRGSLSRGLKNTGAIKWPRFCGKETRNRSTEGLDSEIQKEIESRENKRLVKAAPSEEVEETNPMPSGIRKRSKIERVRKLKPLNLQI